MRRRTISFILCAVMVFSLLPALSNNPVKAATTSQNNIVARADYLYNITWTAQSTVYGWNYNYTFYAGNTYRIPYGQPINSGAYIGYYVSIEDFLTAANTAGSVFYTSRSTYSSTSSVYYATDCSAFVSWCWGIDRKTTYSIPQVSTYIGMATAANAYSLQLGDCLNSNDVGHVVLVTDLQYSGSTLTSIEITEQTPPQLKRSYYTPAELGAKYGTYYGIYRYTGEVPAAPDGSTNDDTGSSSTGSTTTITSKYYPACDSSYTSLAPAMASIGVDMDWELQCEIAELNGITDFEGTAEQNTTLLNLLKAGTLLNPNYVPVSYYPACDSSCTTFYEGMSNIGIDCDWALHCEIAAANGITDFTGTAEQNTTLLNLLKAGKLITPGTGSSDSTDNSGSSGTVVSGSNGYERGYEGGMAGTGEYKAFGLDVSAWQGSDLDFNMIKNAGYDFVILRAGTTKGKDSLFDTYYTNAKAAGLDVGAYYYSYALDVATSASDAENMISYLSGKQFEYPIYFDYEDPTQLELDSSLSQSICLTFLDMLAEEGYLVGLYTGKYFSTQIPTETICEKYEVWIAHYLAVGDGVYDGTDDYTTYGPAYSTQYGMYQFTDSVWINGNGHYDGDVAFKDYPSIVKQYGFNGYEAEIQDDSYLGQCTFYPSHCNVKVNQTTGIFSEPRMAASDNISVKLEDISGGTIYTAIGLYQNADNDLFYQVETSDGQTGYIYAGYTDFVDMITSDITVTGCDLPNGHVKGNYFLVTGTIQSTYNALDNAQVYIYSGFGISGVPITGGSASVTDDQYVLDSSAIDSATAFDTLSTGPYTYYVGAAYTSYYAKGAQVLSSVSDTKILSEHYFTVVNSSVSQSSCTHSNTVTVVEQATCISTGTQVTSCSICGLTSSSTVSASGHSYDVVTHPATCTDYATNEYTCSGCGNYYKVYAGELTDWLDTKPEGVDERLLETKTEYRYSDYETKTSYATSLDGFTLKSSQWEQTGTGSVSYVKTWPEGFSTSSSNYTKYDNKSSKVTASETTTNKTVVNSDAVSGYLYFHWCYTDSYTSLDYKTNTYTTFHSFFSESLNYTNYDSSDGSYENANSSCCTNSDWYWYVPVYTQSYTTYQNLFTYERWTDWSGWSETTVTASDTRQVEQRTLYRYYIADLGDHTWDEGTITTVPTCTTEGVMTHTCTSCGKSKTETITADGHSWNQATCTEAKTCSLCGISSGSTAAHNYVSVVSAPQCLKDGYTTHTCSVCGDSYTDSYVTASGHSWVSASCTEPMTCTTCGATAGSALGHNYVSVVTPAECQKGGYTTHTCSTCGDTYTDSYVSASGHSWVDASCTEPMTCTTCGATIGSAMGHDYQSIVTDPTCTEAGYTTYTCSLCGDSYVADEVAALGHGALTYALTDNVHTFTCNVCGEVAMTKEATDDKTFKINSAAPVLSDDIVMKYRATVPAGFENAYMVFDFDGEQFTVTDYTIDESTGRYCYAFPGINSLKMGLNICATLYATVDGVQVSVQIAEYSMLKYCDNQLKKTTTDTLRTVLSDVLTYGAKAQTYVGYMTDALVTDLVSDSSTLTPSAFPEGGLTDDYNKQVVSGTAIDAVNYNGVTLLLGSKVRLRLTVTCTDLTAYTYKITVGSNVYEFTGADLEATSTANRYYLYFDNLRAIDFGEIITCTIECDGVQVSRSLQYTVYTYIQKNQGTSDTALKELLEAIYNYGESAKKV